LLKLRTAINAYTGAHQVYRTVIVIILRTINFVICNYNEPKVLLTESCYGRWFAYAS